MSQPPLAEDTGLPGASWRLCDDAAGAHAIHRIALELAPAGMVRPDSLSHFIAHTGSEGVMLGCYLNNETLVAYGLLGLHSPIVGELAGMLTLDPQRLCVLDGAAALPQYRGFGMHHATIARRLAYAATCGHAWAAATVSPANLRALRSLLRAGLQIRRFANMYGALPRLIMQRDLQQPAPAIGHVRDVAANDVAAHRAALDEGLTGYCCSRRDDGAWEVSYGWRSASSPSSP